MAVAYKAEAVSGGSMGALTLRMIAAFGVGLAVVVGVWRIVLGHSMGSYLIPGYLVVVGLTAISPPQLVGLAFDSGGVVAFTVTAPLLTALGVGLATSIRGRNPMLDGFGLIAFGALAPMIIIQVYGIFFFVPAEQGVAVVMMPSDDQHHYAAVEMLIDFATMVRNLLPIIAVVLFSSFVILRRPLADPKGLAVGMTLVAVGLFMFDEGLQVGLFPLGDEMTNGLMRDGVPMWAVYLYGFLIGFATTMAEPALIALSIKADDVSLGQRLSLFAGFARCWPRHRHRLRAHHRRHQHRLLADPGLPAGPCHDAVRAAFHRADRLRLWWRDDVNGDRSTGHRAWRRPRRANPRPRSADRRLRPDCLRFAVADDHRHVLWHACHVVAACADT